MINDEEKQYGFNSKCCRKTILRLAHGLSKEGLLKIYKTTVIQDGITKKPNDDIVNRVLDQIRFKISSSYSAVRLQHAEEKARELERDMANEDEEFKPTMGNCAASTADQQTADTTLGHLDVSSSGDEEEEVKEKSILGRSEPDMKVYVDEDSWKRFVPPVRVHKEFSSGWALVGDLLVCLPLSVFIQVIQINYKRRRYTFNTAEDVENYWFDMMCVCLNTPLGVIRGKRNASEVEAPSFVHERILFVGMATLLKGSLEVCDDGTIPGDGKGAGGLDSEFFAHLKRNWLWTSHLLSVKTTPSGLEAKENKIRLKSLLSRNALRIALKAGGTGVPRYMTAKRPLVTENVEVDIEPASRNQQVVGGKKQKRKRSKKEVVKAPRRKKKEPKKRTPAHDEADHQALKMMTRQRVYWSIQEDSLMMLCSVAAHLLNSKLKRPFVPHCVVRDLLHAEFEISMDKTSLAVGRRSKYILKNPQTLLNYRICLAEVYQDKTMMRLLEEKKPANPDNPEDCAKVFSEYVRLLRQKFSTALSVHDTIIPDTKHELFSRFRVSAIDSVKRVACKDTLNCTDDIHAIVLHNLIQSTLAMTNNQMKSSRSFQAFHMYSKYNQDLLCQAFIRCRKRGLVNRRRVNQPFGPKKKRALPILPMSYQLSQSYYRCFSWRFPHSLCTDAYRFLRSLMNNKTGADRPVTIMAALDEEDDDDDDGDECEGRKRLEVKAHQASHTNYLMMRGFCSPGIGGV
ncbi:General transcription factor 3C polypeptide 1 [Nibea albiflora]|uniref:General transcription factor 3C polypeptide 1 n=1 Tax=Nibea albiflora TaxID=240163 RepID=A0ACB7FKQ5_NIBAL|nr:General transcription factor 3C polypeptide 1 [Nibea albiflora]